MRLVLGTLLVMGLWGTACHKPKAKVASLELYTGYGTPTGGVLFGRVGKRRSQPLAASRWLDA